MRDYYTNYPRTILWLIPGGEIRLGGPDGDTSPGFQVSVEPFYLSKFPITNEQFEAFDPGFERSPAAPEDRDPALGVSWDDADEYCRWYAEVSRKPMRLPTEVEWEYACRGGVETARYFGDGEADDFLWHRGNCPPQLPPLEDKKPNPFGLNGMLGGAWEWTASPYRPYPLNPESPTESAPGEARVLRGGCFRDEVTDITCYRRRAEPPDAEIPEAGFRVARSLRSR